MSKTAPAKTNGHPVDAINAVAQKAAARPLPKAAAKAPVKAAAKAPAKAAARVAPKAPAKTAAKAAPAPAAKKAAAPAAKGAAKPVASNAAARPATKATAKPTPKSSAKAAPKDAAKASPKATPKAVQGAGEREKTRKPKLVRDSFTMPEEEYAVLALVKKACLKAGFEIKKSELLRVGVALISQIDMATLRSVLASLPQLKTGRPKSS